MFSEKFFFFSLNDFLFPSLLIDGFGELSLFDLFLGSEGVKFFLPESLNLSFVFDLFHSSLLLGHLLDFILTGELFKHGLPEFHFHSFFFLLLSDFFLSGLSFSILHLEFLKLPLLGFFLLFSSGEGFEFFSIKLNSQILELFGISSSFLFLLFKFFENFIFSDFFLLFGHLYCFFS